MCQGRYAQFAIIKYLVEFTLPHSTVINYNVNCIAFKFVVMNPMYHGIAATLHVGADQDAFQNISNRPANDPEIDGIDFKLPGVIIM